MGLHTKVWRLIPSAVDQYGAAWMGISDAWVVEWVAMHFHHSLLSLSKGINTTCRIRRHLGHCFQGNDGSGNEDYWASPVKSVSVVRGWKHHLLLLWGLRNQAGWEFSLYKLYDLSSSHSNWNQALCTFAENLIQQFEMNLFQKKIARFLFTESQGESTE